MKTNQLFIDEFDTIIDYICDDFLIADQNGVILKASPTFDRTYDLPPSAMVGRSVYKLEEDGYFRPSITRLVIESGKKMTISQQNKRGRDIVVTAIPIFDSQNKIHLVISFSRDITDFISLQNQYKNLKDQMSRYENELELLRNEKVEIDGVVAESPEMIKLMQMIRRIAGFDASVLLTGHSGVGKSMMAKLIHNQSSRKEGPYIEINCGAIPENLLESELFGYEKGSFTGANREGKVGLIELSQGGTLFLDEISELPLSLQVKLLKVIQDKKIMRVGGRHEIYVDFRLITASNKELEEQVRNGSFREDLYYRLKVIPLEIPPLKDRIADILPMSTFFIQKFNALYALNKHLSQEVIDYFYKYNWPGNIRELQNLIEQLVLTSETDEIKLESLPEKVLRQNTSSYYFDGDISLNKAVEMLEQKMVCNAYAKCGTTVGVAKLLGVSQPTAVRKIKKYVTDVDK